MTWTHCEVCWDLDFKPSENEAGSQCHWRAFGVWLGGYFLAWVLIGTIIHPGFKHAVSHVARVCTLGH